MAFSPVVRATWKPGDLVLINNTAPCMVVKQDGTLRPRTDADRAADRRKRR